mmetsp:Transcript_77116/g.205971  ORF Transcript_77116/g.205971 Transcript_77116/m.205971 type:complete len:264 (-) Transcript_77116:324-1115(-)
MSVSRTTWSAPSTTITARFFSESRCFSLATVPAAGPRTIFTALLARDTDGVSSAAGTPWNLCFFPAGSRTLMAPVSLSAAASCTTATWFTTTLCSSRLPVIFTNKPRSSQPVDSSAACFFRRSSCSRSFSTFSFSSLAFSSGRSMPDILGMAPRPSPASRRLVSMGFTCFPLGSKPMPRSIAMPKLSTDTRSNCSLSVSGRIFSSSSYNALSACLPCFPSAFKALRFSHNPEFCIRIGTAASASRCAAEVSPLASALISSRAA